MHAQPCKLSMQLNGSVTHRRIAAGLHPCKGNPATLVGPSSVAHARFVPFVAFRGGTVAPDRSGADPRGTSPSLGRSTAASSTANSEQSAAQLRMAALRARRGLS